MKVLSFLLAHQAEFAGLLAALVALLRCVPAPVVVAFERKHPRLALLYRALRKCSPDLLPAAKAVAAALRPPPHDNVIPMPPRHPRTGEPQ